MRPNFAQVRQPHGLPKIHEDYKHLPPFYPIIGTTNTAHHGIAKYLSNLLHNLTRNEFTVKDSFGPANKIETIPNELFHKGYRIFKFDITSLLTNVPLNRTIKIILKRIYENKIIHTTH